MTSTFATVLLALKVIKFDKKISQFVCNNSIAYKILLTTQSKHTNINKQYDTQRNLSY